MKSDWVENFVIVFLFTSSVFVTVMWATILKLVICG